MPFITEEIWHAMYDGKPPLPSIALAAFPVANDKQMDASAEKDMSTLQDLITSIRNLRAELKVDQKLRVPVQIFTEQVAGRVLVEQNLNAVQRLANVDSISFVETSGESSQHSQHFCF